VIGSRLAFAATLALLFSSLSGANDEPRVHLFGIWPNQLRLFDEATDEFVGDIYLKFGATTNSAHSPDFSKFYFVTDRMEAVEVVDLLSRTVVDSVKLSEQARQIRISSVAVNPAGTLLYVTTTPVNLEIDRFVPEESAIFIYDLENKRIQETVQFPKEATGGFRTAMYFAPDGKSLFLLGRDIYQLSLPDHEVIDTIKLSKPLLAGYGPLRGARLVEAEPGVYYGLYRTQDPFLNKTMIGVLELDLLRKEVDSFELGPNVNVSLFALSSDRKRAYGAPQDFIAIDLESRRITKRVERIEQGRPNTALLVSGDGKKLYVGGVGDLIQIYDTGTLAHVKDIFAGGDFMSAPIAVPRAIGLAGATKSN
jgi:DNA-binding beta-propeller fold protein YncE